MAAKRYTTYVRGENKFNTKGRARGAWIETGQAPVPRLYLETANPRPLAVPGPGGAGREADYTVVCPGAWTFVSLITTSVQ